MSAERSSGVSPMSTDRELAVTPTEELRQRAVRSLERCGVTLEQVDDSPALMARTPITGEPLFPYPQADRRAVELAVAAARDAFLVWRNVPAPKRGALVKRLGQLLSDHKDAVGELIMIEVGKIRSEALGEVQEMIDICEFAVGLSRQLDGRTIASERL